MRLAEDRDFFARHPFERFLDVRMRAVLIGRIPEGDPVVIGGIEQLGEAAQAQFARLVGTATRAIGAAALRQAAHLHLHGTQLDAVGGQLLGGASEQMIRKIGERSRSHRCMIKRSTNPMTKEFQLRVEELTRGHDQLVQRPNEALPETSGWFERYRYPVLTAAHAPLYWRYDFDPERNPFLLERQAVNAASNVGAMEWNGNIVLMARVEGADRKSFLAVAESANGIDGFRFWDYPVVMPEGVDPETNVYDMRLTAHEDGWIYGLFCAERKDPNAPPGDLSSAENRP